jgi:hypothetical protein
MGSGAKKTPDRNLIDPGMSHFYPQDLTRHLSSAKIMGTFAKATF